MILSRLPIWCDATYYRDILRNPEKYTILYFDTETTNISKGTATDKANDIVLACWSVEKDGKLSDTHAVFGDEYSQGQLVKAIQSADLVVAHNIKFDAQWLSRCGVDLRTVPAYCTMMGQWVLLGNLGSFEDLSLNSAARRYNLPIAKIDTVSSLIKSGVCPSEIPRKWLETYCHMDVELCRRVFHEQRREVLGRKQDHIVHNRSLTSMCLAAIEFEGMTLDAPLVMEEYTKAMKELAESYAALQAIAPDVNFNSPKQLVNLLYNELGFTPIRERKNGKFEPVLSSNSKVLAKLTATTEKQREFLAKYKTYNKYSALVSKNLEFFKRVCEEYECRFIAVFNQGATDTHRLSSSGRSIIFKGEKQGKSVQFQNIPRSYKRLFCSTDPNYLIGEADAAQLEFRVAAALGNDQVAIKEIIEGADVHSITAQVLTDAGEPTTRQEAKASTFAPLYGGNGSTPAQQEYATFFKQKYSGISQTQRGWALEVLDRKELVLPYGMRYFWPDTKLIAKTGYITNTTSIYNYPVQGLATAEIIPMVLWTFWYLTSGTDFRIVNTIHDSIITLVPVGKEKEYEELSKLCFTDAAFELLLHNYDFEFVAPLGCGIKVSRNWGASETEVIYNVLPDGTCTRKVK